MVFTQLLLVLSIIAVVHVWLRKLASRRRSRGYRLPPSRPQYPFLGNMLEIPTANEGIIYRQWAKELNSDIFYIDAAGTPIVVLNTLELALEMLDGRSSIYSSRPESLMLRDLMGWDWTIAHLPYGKKWRERRRLFQKYLSPSNREFIVPYEIEEITKLLVKLADAPEDFLAHIRHMVGAFAISLTYGLPVKHSNDPYIEVGERGIKTSADAAVPGEFYVDFIPVMKYIPEWFPGATFKRKAREWRVVMEQVRDEPFRDSEARITAGSAPVSFVSKALKTVDPGKDMEYQRNIIVDTAGMVFAAAADTSTSALGTFFLAMMCYPEVQVRLQKELDRVLEGRLPQPQDEVDGKLPYMTAVVKEVLRWKPATPISVPHKSDQDDIFHDYFIPKGTIVIANAWGMLHNEEVYHDPEEFIPERFLDSDGNLDEMVVDPGKIAFGFGRRVCPGAHIARSTTWLAAASIATLYDISKPLDTKGNPIEPDLEYGNGIVSHPRPFKCVIKPRSEKAAGIIQSLKESNT